LGEHAGGDEVLAPHRSDSGPVTSWPTPHDQEIVAYCRGAYCVLAHDAVRLLTAHGRPARSLSEGMLEWRVADLPIAT
jgi:rhodanese-related sulfurtransferase